MKKKIRVLSLLAVAAVVLCLYVLRVVQLNRDWPPPTLEIYHFGETVEAAYNAEVVVHSARFMTQEELDTFEYLNEDWETKCILVDFSITNQSDVTYNLEPGYFRAAGGAWDNGFEFLDFYHYNSEDAAMSPLLAPGETARMKFAFAMVDVQFRDYQWPHVAEKPYWLVITSYPVVRAVELFPENAA